MVGTMMLHQQQQQQPLAWNAMVCRCSLSTIILARAATLLKIQISFLFSKIWKKKRATTAGIRGACLVSRRFHDIRHSPDLRRLAARLLLLPRHHLPLLLLRLRLPAAVPRITTPIQSR